MGFGSSGGGFSPSPNNVPGSTQTGTDQTDSHQFTGSVQITGSLLLNGSSITPGGGGGGTSPGGLNTYVQYNNGGNFAGSANFSFDGSGISVSQDQDATSSIGRAAIGGAGLADAATFSHLDHNSTTNYAFRQRGGTGQTDINAANGQPISFQQNGSTKAVLDASAQFGIGNGIVPSAVLHVSSSATTDLFKVEHTSHTDNPIFVVTGSGRVGIGTATPSAVLDVHPDNAAGSNEVKFRGSNGTSHFYFSAAEHTYIRGGKQTSTVFIADARNTGGSDNQKCIIGNATSTTAQLHVSSSDNSTVMNVTSNSGSILTALENQRVGVGISAPTAMLHVSGAASTTDTLFRIDHETQSGPEPIFFVSSSGVIGIGTDNPLASTPSDNTNRLHIVGNNGAEQNERPVINTQLVLENDNHAGLQFMFPSGRAGQITWGIPGVARKAVFYYATDNNRYTWEGAGFGDARIMTMIASGDSINIGKSNSSHMLTSKASLHISSSTGGLDTGGPVLLRVDHADQPNAAPILFVTGSGQVGIGTSSPGATLEVSGTFLMPGDKPIQLRDSTSNINSPFAGIMQLSASLTEITNDVMLSSPNVPGTAGASGQPGMIAWDADYFYVCVGVNSWKRVAIAAW